MNDRYYNAGGAPSGYLSSTLDRVNGLLQTLINNKKVAIFVNNIKVQAITTIILLINLLWHMPVLVLSVIKFVYLVCQIE